MAGTVVVCWTVDAGPGTCDMPHAEEMPGSITIPGRASRTVRRWVHGPTAVVDVAAETSVMPPIVSPPSREIPGRPT
ncbi:hypothetical protein NCCP2495_09540 [Dietzia sp. NCCP-2495]|nr:hypothetical protein NCCP2495_09540 [Dietzia sp. NCCP-2495]